MLGQKFMIRLPSPPLERWIPPVAFSMDNCPAPEAKAHKIGCDLADAWQPVNHLTEWPQHHLVTTGHCDRISFNTRLAEDIANPPTDLNLSSISRSKTYENR